jgi:hypothetical protein
MSEFVPQEQVFFNLSDILRPPRPEEEELI